MSTHDVDGLNAGYARALLDDYLENPEAVPSEWRALFVEADAQFQELAAELKAAFVVGRPIATA